METWAIFRLDKRNEKRLKMFCWKNKVVRSGAGEEIYVLRAALGEKKANCIGHILRRKELFHIDVIKWMKYGGL